VDSNYDEEARSRIDSKARLKSKSSAIGVRLVTKPLEPLTIAIGYWLFGA
jgi:hypothetical protein